MHTEVSESLGSLPLNLEVLQKQASVRHNDLLEISSDHFLTAKIPIELLSPTECCRHVFRKAETEEEHTATAKQKRKTTSAVEEVTFDNDARHEFLTGFHKRKQQRIKFAQEQAAKQARQEKLETRKQVLACPGDLEPLPSTNEDGSRCVTSASAKSSNTLKP